MKFHKVQISNPNQFSIFISPLIFFQVTLFQRILTKVQRNWVTTMLVTDVGNKICWWQVSDVGDHFKMNATDWRCLITNIPKKVANIVIMSPTSYIGHHHKITKITLSPTWLSPEIAFSHHDILNRVIYLNFDMWKLGVILDIFNPIKHFQNRKTECDLVWSIRCPKTDSFGLFGNGGRR